jgi:hypothetical protein
MAEAKAHVYHNVVPCAITWQETLNFFIMLTDR